MVEMKPSGVKFNLAMLRIFVTEIGVDLESSYVDFLQENNGGIPESNVIQVANEKINSLSITSFFGLGLEKINNVVDVFHNYHGRIPNGLIPVAMAEGGNLICLSLNKADYGKIYFWDHDSELLPVESGDSISFVANSFKEFLEKIHLNSGDVQPEYEVEEIWIDPGFLKEFSGK